MANMSGPKHWSGYVVECYDCGFVLEGGGYDCPACNELALGTENRRLNSRVFVILEDNKRLRKALEQIRDMPNRIYEGFSADGECSSHTIAPPDARKMQRIAWEALEGGNTDD
jgi:hypothetical protein